MKKLLIAALAVLTIFVLDSCEEETPIKIDFHGCPLEEVYIPESKTFESTNCTFDKSKMIDGASFITGGGSISSLKYYDKTNNTVSYLTYREDLGYCYEIYNADAKGEPIYDEDTYYYHPLMVYLIRINYDRHNRYKWAAKDSKTGKVVVGDAGEIVGSVNLIKDSMLPDQDHALEGWFCGYFDGEDSHYGEENGDKFISFTNVFVWLYNELWSFMDNQQEYGIDTFDSSREGYVDRISKLAAIPWEKTSAVPTRIKGLAIGLDAKGQPIFE